MSLSTSMMADPFARSILQRQQSSSSVRRKRVSQESVENSTGAAAQYKNTTCFNRILSDKDKKNIVPAGGAEILADAVTDDDSKLEEYTQYLRSKYGNLTIKSVGKAKKTLDQLGKTMSGSDVIIAPNILEEMAKDPEKASYYEGKIDAFFADIPRQTALFAAKGLDYQPCGVVVHEDGSVTYIGGCADSPERVAQVNAINKAKREKQAAERKAALERSQEADGKQQELMERYLSMRDLSISAMSDFGLREGYSM